MSENKNLSNNRKKDLLNKEVEHIDITKFDSREIISLESNFVISICSISLLKRSFFLLLEKFLFSDIKQQETDF